MNRTLLLGTLVGSIVTCIEFAGAQAILPGPGTPQPEVAGLVEEPKVEVISQNGGLTRKPCPYTCAERNLPKEHCKTWKSKDETLCYVWDTRLPQNAVPLGK